MDRHNVSQNDLEQDLRLGAQVVDFEKVQLAQLERNGEISVQRKPQRYDIEVKDGVQVIRLFIE